MTVSGIQLRVLATPPASPDTVLRTLTFDQAKTPVITVGRKPSSPQYDDEIEELDSADCAMFRCPVISRKHAKIMLSEEGHAYIVDLKSHHGTHILKAHETVPKMLTPETPTILEDGDVLTFGKAVGREANLVHPISVRVALQVGTPSPPISVARVGLGALPANRPWARFGLTPPTLSCDSASSSDDSDSDIEEIPNPYSASQLGFSQSGDAPGQPEEPLLPAPPAHPGHSTQSQSQAPAPAPLRAVPSFPPPTIPGLARLPSIQGLLRNVSVSGLFAPRAHGIVPPLGFPLTPPSHSPSGSPYSSPAAAADASTTVREDLFTDFAPWFSAPAGDAAGAHAGLAGASMGGASACEGESAGAHEGRDDLLLARSFDCHTCVEREAEPLALVHEMQQSVDAIEHALEGAAKELTELSAAAAQEPPSDGPSFAIYEFEDEGAANQGCGFVTLPEAALAAEAFAAEEARTAEEALAARMEAFQGHCDRLPLASADPVHDDEDMVISDIDEDSPEEDDVRPSSPEKEDDLTEVKENISKLEDAVSLLQSQRRRQKVRLYTHTRDTEDALAALRRRASALEASVELVNDTSGLAESDVARRLEDTDARVSEMNVDVEGLRTRLEVLEAMEAQNETARAEADSDTATLRLLVEEMRQAHASVREELARTTAAIDTLRKTYIPDPTETLVIDDITAPPIFTSPPSLKRKRSVTDLDDDLEERIAEAPRVVRPVAKRPRRVRTALELAGGAALGAGVMWAALAFL